MGLEELLKDLREYSSGTETADAAITVTELALILEHIDKLKALLAENEAVIENLRMRVQLEKAHEAIASWPKWKRDLVASALKEEKS